MDYASGTPFLNRVHGLDSSFRRILYAASTESGRHGNTVGQGRTACRGGLCEDGQVIHPEEVPEIAQDPDDESAG
ncbi:MAG: hypothetical protein VCG02_00365 [Verrucomicrobiota bacterium]